MPTTLSFLHTAPIHIPTFDTLIKDQAPAIPVTHLLDEDFPFLNSPSLGVATAVAAFRQP